MAEYLSPGVYVEEFESGGKPMTGVSTSTAGFLGLAVRGPVIGTPQLVTNPADFKRKYGGYLSEQEFGNYRFLAYAIDQFFMNGGSRCFVMRVCPADAKAAATATEEEAASKAIVFRAKNPGTWGNDIKVKITPAFKAKTHAILTEEAASDTSYTVKSNAGFQAGDTACYVKEEVDAEDPKKKTYTYFYNRVTKSQDNIIQFEEAFAEDIKNDLKEGLPTKFIYTCEFNMEVIFEDAVEFYETLSFNPESANHILKKTAKSELVAVACNDEVISELIKEKPLHPCQIISGNEVKDVFGNSKEDACKMVFVGGSNGTVPGGVNEGYMIEEFDGEDKGPGRRSGIKAFIDNDIVSLMIAPGITDPVIQLKLVAHCENLASRFAILDIPRDNKSTEDVIKHREIFDSHYAAMYHPWLEIYDGPQKRNNMMPPSGTIAGIYSRSDNERGVHKAPANEVVRGVTGLDCIYNKGEQDILNPKGANLIRPFPGQGIRVWGARTCSSNALWRYVNVRRLFIFLEESIKANTNWVVFEPNDEVLWMRVRRTIEVFLTTVWRSGALFGSSPDEAFFVDIGHSTMSQDDIDNGRLICVIGVAPVKPAEFVIFRLTQKTREE